LAKAIVKHKLSVTVTFEIDEEEARALDDMAGYGTDAFIEAFYDKLGKAYMVKHEQGLRRFLDSIRSIVRPAMAAADKAREAVK
jgi:hypothetical protein